MANGEIDQDCPKCKSSDTDWYENDGAWYYFCNTCEHRWSVRYQDREYLPYP